MPAVMRSKPGPLAPWANALRNAVVTTGEALEREGHRSLGDAIAAAVEDLRSGGSGGGGAVGAAALVAELADTFPAFQDKGLHNGQQVTTQCPGERGGKADSRRPKMHR